MAAPLVGCFELTLKIEAGPSFDTGSIGVNQQHPFQAIRSRLSCGSGRIRAELVRRVPT